MSLLKHLTSPGHLNQTRPALPVETAVVDQKNGDCAYNTVHLRGDSAIRRRESAEGAIKAARYASIKEVGARNPICIVNRSVDSFSINSGSLLQASVVCVSLCTVTFFFKYSIGSGRAAESGRNEPTLIQCRFKQRIQGFVFYRRERTRGLFNSKIGIERGQQRDDGAEEKGQCPRVVCVARITGNQKSERRRPRKGGPAEKNGAPHRASVQWITAEGNLRAVGRVFLNKQHPFGFTAFVQHRKSERREEKNKTYTCIRPVSFKLLFKMPRDSPAFSCVSLFSRSTVFLYPTSYSTWH